MKVKCFNGHDCDPFDGQCKVCGASLPVANEITSPQTAVATLESQNTILLKWLENIKITTQEERKSCTDMLTNGRTAKRNAETALKEATEPARKEIEDIKAEFKPYIEKLDTGIKSLVTAMSAWDSEQERLNKELLAQVTEQQVNEATGEVVSVVTQPVADISKSVNGHVGSDSRMEGFDIKITNPDLVPRQYCEPSLVKLRAGFKLVNEIPGALKVPKTIYRTKAL